MMEEEQRPAKRSLTEMTGTAMGTAVVVRVGGVEFRTSRETLEQSGCGYFAALFRHQQLPQMDFGRGEMLSVIDVDRDPEPFRHVLAWMRSHRLPASIVGDKQALDDLDPEAQFFALDGLAAAVKKALAPLRRATESLRAFSLTTGTVLLRNCGTEIQQAVMLAPHEYCFISYATCATLQFSLPRKHHKVTCSFEERDVGSDSWQSLVPTPTAAERQAIFGAAMQAQAASRVVVASFVFKHMEDKEKDDSADCGMLDKAAPTDGVCAPQYTQRLGVILGPRGVHNPDTIPAGDGTKETRCVFGDKYDMENGATWSLFGVIGPAGKVLEYASRFA